MPLCSAKNHDGIQTFLISGIGNETGRFWNPAPLMQNYMIKSVKMTKKSIFREQFSWKIRTFAQNLCENGRSSERQHACMIGRVAPDEGKANGLHLGKEQALCTRFAPSLSHAFSQRHHFILLNYPTELRPRKGFNEQIQMYIEAALHSADFNHSTFGAVAGLVGYMGRGLRFLYAHTDSAPPTRL